MQTIIHPSALLVHAKIALFALLPAVCLPTLQAQLNIPSDGSDGALRFSEGALTPNISIVEGTNAVIDLSLAVTGAWNDNNLANAGLGIYDPEQWAVVFKYTSVEIPAGMQVSFKNHPSYAPIVWLVQDSVEIGETALLDLRGKVVNTPLELLVASEPGPGGFRGYASGPSGRGWGFGPGGASGALSRGDAAYRSSYGNPAILPLIGGSGAGLFSGGGSAMGSAAGGGAILIAAVNDVIVDGSILASTWGAPISTATGGAIRIVAHQVLGGRSHDFNGGIINAEREGRTRIEANVVSEFLKITPNIAAVAPGETPMIWPPATTPTVRVISVDGQAAPLDPRAGLNTSSDLGIQTNDPVEILLETRNLPVQGAVRLRVGPKYAAAQWLNATYVSGDIDTAIWSVTTTLPPGFTVLQARATAP